MAERLCQLQCISDLHLEFYKNDPNQFEAYLNEVSNASSAEYFVIAGDLGYPFDPHYEAALQVWSQRFKRIILVAGNHEMYNTHGQHRTVEEIIQQIQMVCSKFPNVHFLHNSSVDISVQDGERSSILRFIGTTLWYHTRRGLESYVQNSLNDYRCTYVNDEGKVRRIQPSDVNEWHQRDKNYLAAAVEEAKTSGIACIVVTHHLPTYQLIAPQYQGSELNFAFATSLNECISTYPVVASICGHSHATRKVLVGDRKVPALLNAAGYPHENISSKALNTNNCLLDIYKLT